MLLKVSTRSASALRQNWTYNFPMTGSATITALIDQLDEARINSGLSQRDWALQAGLSLGTVREWRHHRSTPGSVRLAELGLTLDLRLELIPNARTRKRTRLDLPEVWRSDERYAKPERRVLNASYLVAIVIAELAWHYEENPYTRPVLDRRTRQRVLYDYSSRRTPNVTTLLALGEHYGFSLGWIGVSEPWRARPWPQTFSRRSGARKPRTKGKKSPSQSQLF